MTSAETQMVPSLAKIGAALAKAQGQIKNAVKDASNDAFKRNGAASKYATLVAIWDACRAALSENEIAVIQAPRITDRGLTIHTILLHSSGEMITGDYPVNVPATATAQQTGSAITYARKYSLASMAGVAPDDDDDGNAEAEARRPAPVPEARKADPPKAAKPGDFWQQEKLVVPFPAKHLPAEGQTPSPEALKQWKEIFLLGLGSVPSRDKLAAYQHDNQHIIDLFPAETTLAICTACSERALNFDNQQAGRV